jgi:hypothetical protein
MDIFQTNDEQSAKGQLPNYIESVLRCSLESINLEGLRAWLYYKGIQLKIAGQSEYKLPTLKELESLVVNTIEQYYYRNVSETDYKTFEVDVNENCGYTGAGINLITKDFYFEVDFLVYVYDDLRDDIYIDSFIFKSLQMARLN